MKVNLIGPKARDQAFRGAVQVLGAAAGPL
jgi:hypothetical protein